MKKITGPVTIKPVEFHLQRPGTVSPDAVIARINANLKPHDQRLRTARSDRVRLDFGNYYVEDSRGFIVQLHVDPERLARQLGVLASYETVED